MDRWWKKWTVAVLDRVVEFVQMEDAKDCLLKEDPFQVEHQRAQVALPRLLVDVHNQVKVRAEEGLGLASSDDAVVNDQV